jgi:hypothetical protein
MIWAIIFSVFHAPLPLLDKFGSRLQLPLWKLESWNFDFFNANLMQSILRILKFRFLRVATNVFDVFLSRPYKFSSPQNAIIVFRRLVLVEKSVVTFILGWNFLNKTLFSDDAQVNFSIQQKSYVRPSSLERHHFSWKRKKTKLPFCSKSCYLSISVLLGVLRSLKFWVLRVYLPYKFRLRMGKLKFYSTNFSFTLEQIWQHF